MREPRRKDKEQAEGADCMPHKDTARSMPSEVKESEGCKEEDA